MSGKEGSELNKRPQTFERKQKVWEEYERVVEELNHEHGRFASEIRKSTLYDEVSIRTGYASSYVAKIVHEILAQKRANSKPIHKA